LSPTEKTIAPFFCGWRQLETTSSAASFCLEYTYAYNDNYVKTKYIIKKIIILILLGNHLCTHAQDIKWVTDVQTKYVDNKQTHSTLGILNTLDKTGSYIKDISFSDTLSMFGKTFYPLGSQSIIVMRFDANGNYKWGITLKAQGMVTLEDMVSDDSCNITVIGDYEGKMQLPNAQIFDTLQYNMQGYIIKFDSSGNIIWAKNHHYSSSGFTFKIINDKQGNLYFSTVAAFAFELAHDSAFFLSSSFAIVKFDRGGNIVLYKRIKPYSGNIAVSDNGKFIYLFSFMVGKSTYIYDKDTLVNPNPKYNYILSAYDDKGDNIYHRMLTANVHDGYEDLAYKNMYVDDVGNCYFTYRHSGILVEAGRTFYTAPLSYPDPVWMKIDINRNIIWAVSGTDSTSSGFAGLMDTIATGIIYTHFRTKQDSRINNIIIKF